MSAQPPHSVSAEILGILQTWADSFRQVLGQRCAPYQIELVSGAELDAALKDETQPKVWAHFLIGGSLRGQQAFFATVTDALQLGQLLMSETLNPAEGFTDSYRDAFGELLRQVAGMAATALKDELGSEVDISFAEAAAPSWKPALQGGFRVTGTPGAPLLLVTCLSDSLVSALEEALAPSSGPAAEANGAPAGTPVGASAGTPEPIYPLSKVVSGGRRGAVLHSQPHRQGEAISPGWNHEAQRRRKARLTTALSEGLPTLQGYVSELNALLSVTPVNLKQVSQVIRTDPSLTAQAIRLYNAKLPGVRSGLRNIEAVVVELGADRLRSLVLTCSLMESTGQQLPASEVRAFWQHSLLTGILSERLAEWTNYREPELAYLAGLLHNLGVLPLWMVAAEERPFVALPTPEDENDPLEAERAHFGMDHCEVGRWMGIAWHFDPYCVEVFEHHHHPEDAVQDPHLVGLVAAADQFCRLHGVAPGSTPRQSPPGRLLEILRACLPMLGATPRARLAEMLEAEYRRQMPALEFGGRGGFGQAPGTPQSGI